MTTRGTKILAVLLLLGLALRLGVASRDLDLLDRMFVPDDTYYTLTIARSLSQGLGPTVDRTVLTNGFQPLWAFLLTPVFLLTDDPDVPLRVALLLSVLFGALGALPLAWLAGRLAGEKAALVAAALWLFSPVVLANELGGLETSLAVTASLFLTEIWYRARASGSPWWFVGAGAICGLSLLSRIDTAILVGLLGLLELLRGNRKGVLLAATAALVIVLPWWGYSTLTFGSPVPESGAAVRAQVAFHQALYLTTPKQIAWAAGTVVGSPFLEAQELREHLFGHPALGTLLGLLLLGAWIALVARIFKRGQRDLPLLALSLHGLGILVFYTFLVPALWFFRRYLHPAHAVVVLFFAFGVAWLWEKRARGRVFWACLAAIALCFVVGLGQSASYLWVKPATTPDRALHGAKGYREVARDALSMLPARGATIGAFQSGALAYYAGDRYTVVNLDGVVDGRAGMAIGRGRLPDYARSRGVAYFIDWPFNFGAFRFFGKRATTGFTFQGIGQTRAQGSDRTLVAKILWPHEAHARPGRAPSGRRPRSPTTAGE